MVVADGLVTVRARPSANAMTFAGRCISGVPQLKCPVHYWLVYIFAQILWNFYPFAILDHRYDHVSYNVLIHMDSSPRTLLLVFDPVFKVDVWTSIGSIAVVHCHSHLPKWRLISGIKLEPCMTIQAYTIMTDVLCCLVLLPMVRQGVTYTRCMFVCFVLLLYDWEKSTLSLTPEESKCR